jgi:hypothetical protein
MQREARRKAFKQVDIYPVTCERLSSGRSNLEVLKAVIQGGARIIQLREKEYSGKKIYDLALKFSCRGRRCSPRPGRPSFICRQRNCAGTAHRRLHSFPAGGDPGPKRRRGLHQYRPHISHRHQRRPGAVFGTGSHCRNQPPD